MTAIDTLEWTEGKLQITVLDIPDSGHGVGLAVILRTPQGKTVLYDTGVGYPEGDGWAADMNSGRDQILPFLQREGIDQIDTLIITHSHYDHFGGLLWLAGRFPIVELIDNGYEFSGEIDNHYSTELAAYERVRSQLRDQGTTYRSVHAGDVLDLDPELHVRVIAPPADFFHELNPEAENLFTICRDVLTFYHYLLLHTNLKKKNEFEL